MAKRFLSTVLVSMFISSNGFAAYDIIKRTRLIDDKLKTQEMLRPFGHDFLLDIGVNVTPDTKDLIDDADKLSKVSTSDTAALVTEATTILTKHYDKENLGRFRLNLGMPIFSFTAFDIKWSPNLRADVGATVVLTPTAAVFNWANFVDVVTKDKDVDASAVALLKTCNPTSFNNGDLLIDSCGSQAGLSAAQIAAIKTQVGTEVSGLKWNTALLNSLPQMNLYAKADAKVGMPVDFTKGQHWYGTFFLGGLARSDIHKACDALAIAADQCDVDFEGNNTVTNLITELKVGYKNSNYSVFAAAEELKLAEMSKETTNAPLKYGTDPLIRLHAGAHYRVWIFSAQPFVGAHARSGYGFGDAYYFGADWGSHVWGDRLGITLRTMMDKEHITLAARFKLWLMHLEATSKLPAKDKVDGTKVAPIWGANIRFFI